MADDGLSIALGLLSIFIALGSGIFYYYLDYSRRKKEEEFFASEIKENIKQISQYFLSIESISTRDLGFENAESEISNSLNNFYVKKNQEMKDILYLTKLYLPQWKSLTLKNKQDIKNILENFSWVLYEYYPMHLPLEIRRGRWQNKSEDFSIKRKSVITMSNSILQM